MISFPFFRLLSCSPRFAPAAIATIASLKLASELLLN